MPGTDRLSLDCASLDQLLGGGVEHGVVTNVYGEAGAGKTNVCMQAIVSCIEAGGTAVFIDTEGGFSTERFVQMHGDDGGLDDVVLYEPTTFEEQQQAFDELADVVAEKDADLVVVDSLVALYRLHLNDEEAQETNTELSRQFSVLSKVAREHDIPVIVTNQVYSKFDEDQTQIVGRDIPSYWSKALLQLEKAGAGKRRAILQKHRSRPEGLHADFYITGDSLSAEKPQGQEKRMKIF